MLNLLKRLFNNRKAKKKEKLDFVVSLFASRKFWKSYAIDTGVKSFGLTPLDIKYHLDHHFSESNTLVYVMVALKELEARQIITKVGKAENIPVYTALRWDC